MPACTSTSGVWYEWTTNTASTSCTAEVWGLWCGDDDWTCNTATTTAWRTWTTAASGSTYTIARAPKPRPLTPEEQARADEDHRKWREQEAARRAERDRQEAERKRLEAEADKRAEELLLAHLDAEQKKEYAKDKTFHVRCRHGRRYRIHRAWSGHVTRLNEQNRPVERFCIHPRESVPLPDNQLLAKLMLETDPDHFRKVANVSALAG